MRRPKRFLRIEHPDGDVETVHLSAPLANALINRLIEPGWPYVSVDVDGKRIISTTKASNVFVDAAGEYVTL